MTEQIRKVKYEGLEAVPDGIKKRILARAADQQFTEYREPLTIAGAYVPERIREITLYDAEPTAIGEHVLYAEIDRGVDAITSVVSASGPTLEAARWRLGRNYNLPSFTEKYSSHRFSVNGVDNIDPL